MAKYYLSENNQFVIEDYNSGKPFANFFPGIAGIYGIPMWVFYCNRGQAISCFGTKDKDHSILEFFPANKAWQNVTTYGFRTFIKLNSGKTQSFYEPFHNGLTNLNYKLSNRMRITSDAVSLEEENFSLGLKIKIEYFNIPNDNYAGLARVVTIKNLSRAAKKIQLLDGLPQIVPYATANFFLKEMGRTIEAWMRVENMDKGVPFYKLDVDPSDRPEVVHLSGGNFYLSFFYKNDDKPVIAKPIIDPQNIFGEITDFSYPKKFFATRLFTLPKNEFAASKTPCGFSFMNQELPASEEITLYSVIGNMRNAQILNSSIPRITKSGYLAKKQLENKELIEGLQNDISTSSGSINFDLYCKQTYLDNILRGGYPVTFGSGRVFYIYSRKHGDLERDYNKFQIQPTYLSQGNGNYRDMNQNRRSDHWFNPEVKEENLINFLNLLQADGFNPLVVKGASFALKENTDLNTVLKNLLSPGQIKEIASLIHKPFAPGDLILFIEDNNIKLSISYDEFLSVILSNSIHQQEAEHGEGFWTDHWTYNLDLLESYLALYPDKLRETVFDNKVFTFFDNIEVVRPRSEKYLLYNGLPRQLHSLSADPAKREMIHQRTTYANTVRTNYGKGQIYQTSLINKLLCLLANKISSLDPFGKGIEMEANKPDWFDALNGLPALFGSSLNETFETKRLIKFIKDSLEACKIERIYLTKEVQDFILSLSLLLEENLSNNSQDKDYLYWDKSYSLKESYRQATKFGFEGTETEITSGCLLKFLSKALAKIENGIINSLDKETGVYTAYFMHEVTEYETLGPSHIRLKKFKQIPLPLFLESQVHALRLAQTPKEASTLYEATRKSSLFDKSLKMYKVTASLADMPPEIGRCTAFMPGWLENESIWLHMEYKYLLETLKQGLYAEFYVDFKNVLIPFQEAQKYGRSILENSSFLVSSAFPDKNLHGNGFVARLSGSTAEFLEIWLIMNVGNRPFFIDGQNKLNLCLNPALAGWLFDKKGLYSFNFLGRIKISYHNANKKDTFGKNAAKIVKISFNDRDGKPIELSSNTIPSPFAEQVRSRLIKEINVYFE